MRDTCLAKTKPKDSKNITLYVLGRMVSLLGTNIYTFAISLYVLKTTGSAGLFSISLAISVGTKVLASGVAGVICDKFDRKKILILMDFISGLVVLGLAGVVSVYELKLSYIYITTFVLALCNVFFDVSMVSSLPNIVNKENLTKINSLNSSTDSLAQILGPVLGGIIYVLIDIRLFLVINGVSFIISAVSEIFIKFDLKVIDDEIDNEAISKKGALIYLKNNRNLIKIILISAGINFLIQFAVVIPIPFIVNNILLLSEGQYGIIQSMFAIGMLVGGVTLSILPQRENNFKRVLIGLSGFMLGIGLLGIIVIPNMITIDKQIYFYLICFLSISISLSVSLVNIPIFVKLQKTIPDVLRGRVFGIVTAASGAIAPLGMILSGILIEKIPVHIIIISSSILVLGIILNILRDKNLKSI